MQYNEIYDICQPIMDWLKEHYPHNHKMVIDANGAEMIECGKLVVADKDLIDGIFDKMCEESKKNSEVSDHE